MHIITTTTTTTSADHVIHVNLAFNLSPVFQYIMKIYREQTMQISQAYPSLTEHNIPHTHAHTLTYWLVHSFVHSLTHSVRSFVRRAVNMIKFLCFDSFWARLGLTGFSFVPGAGKAGGKAGITRQFRYFSNSLEFAYTKFRLSRFSLSLGLVEFTRI